MARVSMIYLPSGEGGKKQGVDDYLANGRSVDDLLGLATRKLKSPPQEEKPDSPYRATPSGLVFDKPTQDGSIPILLTNFNAKIMTDVVQDDGAEERRLYEMEAELNGQRYHFTIPSGRFAGMGWVPERLGAMAIVYPGSLLKEHAKVAIQARSGDVPTRRVFAHTGWRYIDGEWVHLHAGGAIGRVGQVGSIHTELHGRLAGRVLPDPPEGEKLRVAVRASLDLRKVGLQEITVPILSAAYRAPLGDTDFSEHLVGQTGEGKTAVAALVQQHFGLYLDPQNLITWESTENYIEAIAFQAKDQVLLVDDFKPRGSVYDQQRWHAKADRVMRAKGNTAGRGRMRPDTTVRPEKPPRALILSTGEDVPRGHSLRARMSVLELGRDELDWDKLTQCQKAAANGLYAQAMSGYLRWLAEFYEGLQERLKEEHAELRALASTSAQHRRTPSIVADLALGLRYFLRFARESGAISTQKTEELWKEGWLALGATASAQFQHQVADEPTRRFRELLGAAIASGLAHVADPKGDQPRHPTAWGWREVSVGTGENERTAWRQQGSLVGWVEEDSLYLEPEAAYATAQRQGQDSGDQLTITGRTLRKRLDEGGLLQSVDKKRQVLTVRKVVGGRRREVLHLTSNFLSAPSTEPDQPDHGHDIPRNDTTSVPSLWSGLGGKIRSAPDHKPNIGGQVTGDERSDNGLVADHTPDHKETHVCAENYTPGRVGRVPQEEEQEPERRVFSV
jgi:hypothetical protein